MAENLTDREWALLLQRIARGQCTPIIGPDVSAALCLPHADLAKSWAREHDYPLPDAADMPRVAQYLAVQYDPFYPKEKLQEQLRNLGGPDYSQPNKPHARLAELNLPVYLTTNFDDYMVGALRHRQRDPQRELFRWNEAVRRRHPSVLETGYEPTVANPLVYHLYGHHEYLESMVLTEDDYLDFLINISSTRYQLPPRIQRALANASLLLIGYNPLDWDFRVLFRGLLASTESNLRRISVTVQLPPVPDDASPALVKKIRSYLSQYFDIADRRMRVYWGTADDFIAELSQRWQGKATASHPGPAGQAAPPVNLKRLLENLMGSFGQSELRTMAFKLNVDYELLPAPKDDFARELIVYLQNRDRLHELIESCRRERPHIAW